MLIRDGALRTDALPKTKVTPDERQQVEKRVKELGFKKISQYIRYCINKDMEGN